ncbi:hypothetical protein [Falsiroseomonas selenitidurans]|uniref:Uncharacterized protein n=1 Tax=Falsiroseomonas selenitidurans TaxID=2716335 RepID=A0ABX1E226_9PROT|nr:hypothetical protein [Falsiroseomonas selenitidurans]NKC31113.1 hypothetical protein [Falsiroseomonas selenitidurans]
MTIPLLQARPVRGLWTAAVACGLVVPPSPAATQYRRAQQGQKGAAQILRNSANRRFNRCAARISAGPMRISRGRSHVDTISTPAVAAAGPLMLRLVDTPGGTLRLDAITNGQRVSARIDGRSIGPVLRIRGRTKLEAANRRPTDALGNAPMQDILVEVENGAHCAMGRR